MVELFNRSLLEIESTISVNSNPSDITVGLFEFDHMISKSRMKF